MSKNLIVLFIIILLIVGGFGIYTYDQSNQVKKEVEEKNFELGSKDELILELKENIQEKEKQIEELKANLAKGEKDLEQEYATKISELMAEKGQLEALLIEQEGILQTKDREKEELISKLENSNNQINELKDKLVQQGIEGEKDYVAELSALTEEKSTLETQLNTSQGLLLEKESTITILNQQNEESKKNLMEKDKTVTELAESIKGYENQIKEISELMAKEGKEKEAEYAERLALLEESKGIIEAELAEAIKKNIPDYYEINNGDSLWKIAERFYDTGEKWIRIFEANMNKIKNPSMIYPYQRFTIPKE
jgi:chromosome segregation ATPase